MTQSNGSSNILIKHDIQGLSFEQKDERKASLSPVTCPALLLVSFLYQVNRILVFMILMRLTALSILVCYYLHCSLSMRSFQMALSIQSGPQCSTFLHTVTWVHPDKSIKK